jgi:hypothetical protein
MSNDGKSSDNKGLSWEQQELPRAYLRLEGILWQTSWVIQQELKRQQKAMENVKKSVEREVRDPNTWKK